MKATTVEQRKVEAIYTDVQLTSAEEEKALKELNYVGYRKATGVITCSYCFHSFTSVSNRKKLNCKSCKQPIEVKDSKARLYSTQGRYDVLVKQGDYQLIRRYYIKVSVDIKKKERKGISYLAYTLFFNLENLKITVYGKNYNYFLDTWYGDRNLRKLKEHHEHSTFGVKIKSLHPKLLQRMGDNRNFYYNPYLLIKKLFNSESPLIETFYKAKVLPSCFLHFTITEKNLKLYKKAISLNYKVLDFRIWFDYVKNLEKLGKPFGSAQYFPFNLQKSHEKIIKKIEMIEMEKVLSNKEINERYEKKIKELKNIELQDGDLRISVINNIKEVYENGRELKHCVFVNKYYEKPNLLLQAKVGGDLVETISYDLKLNKVLQSRGFRNKESEYHQRILELIKKSRRVLSNV